MEVARCFFLDKRYVHTLGAVWLFIYKNSLRFLNQILVFFFIHSFIWAYIVWIISPLPPTPSLSPPLSSLPGRMCSALFSSFVGEKI
jgi:hypothetical protein